MTMLGAFALRPSVGGGGGGGLTPITNTGAASGNSAAGVAAGATLTFKSDGSITRVGTGTDNSSGSSAWLSAILAGNGAGFWLRATVVSGALASGTTGSWIQGNADRAWVIGPVTTSAASCVLSIDIATDSGGVNIVSSGNNWTVGYSHTAGTIGSPALSAHNFGGDNFMSCTFGNDGTLKFQDANGPVSASHEWMSGSGASSSDCSAYEIVFTYVSGPNLSSGTTGAGGAIKSGEPYATALNLATSRSITISARQGTISGSGGGTLVFDAAIRPAGGGTNLASARMTIAASI